jgi:BirA family transcriptional regulator, biotin operon repressor / biotin---[acetyl-CoA-carboxylase] ligase
MNDDLTAASIAAQRRTQVLGRQLEIHSTLPSTNTRAVELARQGAAEGTLILAEEQTAGRGRLGRRWWASGGSALLLSLILRPPLRPHQAQRSTMLCALGIVAGIARVSGLRTRIKWPNDIIYRGAKLGGLLTELGLAGALLDYVVVGVGINVNLDVAALPPMATPATSICAEVGGPVSRLELLLAILDEIEVRYERLKGGWSPHDEWRSLLATLGAAVQVTGDGEVLEGLAEDVDEDGALLVRTREGIRQRILAGDVTLRKHPAE